MDNPGLIESNEFSVDEGSFWHTNMDLYYGYSPGEIVEVEHEYNKYWLAKIEYCYKHLFLLKWLGNYGEFWIDTTQTSPSTNSISAASKEFTCPKRIIPLGYHLQSQLKSQFTLEKPTKVLIRPSLYNPSKDPYAAIETVDDLLAHEDEHANDNFANQSTSDQPGLGSIVMSKCKTKINYGQKDVDELEAALLNLNEIDSDYCQANENVSPDGATSVPSTSKEISSKVEGKLVIEVASSSNQDSGLDSDASKQHISSPEGELANQLIVQKDCNNKQQSDHDKSEDTFYDRYILEVCQQIQKSAVSTGRYKTILPDGSLAGEDNYQLVKPKQFFDVGGANHERVLVPGTLLEVCHSAEGTNGDLELFHWFAYIIKNIGGRLTLRWFLCNEVKFKQGRVELKSCKAKLVKEEESSDDCSPQTDTTADCTNHKSNETSDTFQLNIIPAKAITFSMHYCDPCIHTINHGANNSRSYKMPQKVMSYLREVYDDQKIYDLEDTLVKQILDSRRINLDKDRAMIDNILEVARCRSPNYLDLNFGPQDETSRRAILISCPKLTKVLHGHIAREIETGVYQVHSEPLGATGEFIKFVYPFNSSYVILPEEWAYDNMDCLSAHPSKEATPAELKQNSSPEGERDEEVVDSISDNLEEENSDTASKITDTNSANSNSLATNDKLSLQSDKVIKVEKIESEDHHSISVINETTATTVMTTAFHCRMVNSSLKELVQSRFKVMDQLEVVHPSSDTTICLGRIRKVVYPLLWIQVSNDCYTVMPFHSTNIYPSGWCETNNHQLITFLPPRKRCKSQSRSHQGDKKRKKAKSGANSGKNSSANNQEKDHLDLDSLNDKQSDIDYILNEKSMYIEIYFNHKCFTGPSLSKGKICSLPQYVGPGPLRLVLEEVVTKIISVAYVPPRVLKDLCSESFEELLIARNLTNTTPMEFKAKYQKRVHRESIPVCVNPDDVALYCECICEYIKCCYNLFGPNLYDGDDCPSHCRALTKSNKFMKRAIYYREKARMGE